MSNIRSIFGIRSEKRIFLVLLRYLSLAAKGLNVPAVERDRRSVNVMSVLVLVLVLVFTTVVMQG